MKVFTSIPPRRDGTVILEIGGEVFTFRSDEQYGGLSCEIPDDAVTLLLDNGNFFTEIPDVVDVEAETDAVVNEDGGDDDEAETDAVVNEDGGDDDEEGDENAPLIEESVFLPANVPLATAARPRGRARKP